MSSINPDLPWNLSGEFYEVDPESSPDVVMLAVITEADGARFAIAQQKGYGWPLLPGGFTMFGGQVEGDENADQAVLREAKEEFGAAFVDAIYQMSGKPTAVLDYHFKNPGKPDSIRRVYKIDLGPLSYDQWCELQSKISQGEAVGRVAVTFNSLKEDHPQTMAHLMYPADRDVLAYILS